MTTAIAQYKERQTSIQELIKRLEDQLAAHGTKANADPQNWGYSGDLGRVEGGLKELVEFFGG